MSKPKSEIKFAILKASYWVGDATEYGCVYWLLGMKGKWSEEFEAAEFFDTRSDAELRLTEEKRVPENCNISIVEVELYRD
ncbi:hypothetical protein [Microcoleus sp. OTE_8_concoct_300]|uniref:hypothetical protein n=1 Tax=Microcoleus sp. OTE_8_concoct_300 TaxID=2964710 RepID=UPI00403F3D26